MAGGWGDDPVNDIRGGRSAGLRTIWVDNGRSWGSAVPVPDHTVADANGAIDHLLQLGTAS
ncbi:HAD hydrolase-like protein [Streptomyces sp. NPDC021020]|uniref:HAD hydrolase-like protein n=1 Tax=Streptomyces sp. NPDC021020 TaxID=3365109 RepID=UPI0037AD4A5B